MRTQVYNLKKVPYLGNNKITYLEFNTSNLCNLVCVGCNPAWSTSWGEFRQNIPWWNEFRQNNGWAWETKDWSRKNFPEWKQHPARSDFVNEFVSKVDLSNLTNITFKGGEPFLNKEIIMLLEYLDSINVLKNISINITTNGTASPDKYLTLLDKCKIVKFNISIDGLGKLNQYIRFDPKNPEKSHTDEIKKNILTYKQLSNYYLRLATTVQAHNIFNLSELADWWHEEITPTKYKVHEGFSHLLFYPIECSLNVFSDNTRRLLIERYEKLNSFGQYQIIINQLSRPYTGDKWHNQFVKYTQALDKTRLATFVELVPEAADEMILL